jgi:hypothetical protein
MRNVYLTIALSLAAGTLLSASPLIVTASNDAENNQLLVYNTSGTLLQSVPTGGKGGATGNAGGIQAKGGLLAVINFGSQSVSIFELSGNQFVMKQSIPTLSDPLSVAFGGDHLYILGTTKVESHAMVGSYVSPSPDGVVALLLADGSAAQVGVLPLQLIIAEKNNVIETVGLTHGAATGVATLVNKIPDNVNTPFGLVTRGVNAYVTIAHANEISLVRNGTVLTTTGSGTQMSPCWLTLAGSFLFSSNSPSKSISKYIVVGQKITQETAVAALLNGAPTDIASAADLLSVIDGDGNASHLSTFGMDADGNLTLQSAVRILGAINGVAIVEGD